MIPAVLLVGPLLLACGGGASSPGDERVLYLHEALPADGSSFGRVNPRTYDLGSLSTSPPQGMEIRACGDVVAFAGAAGVLPDEALEVREVLYRVWWYSGVGRGVFSLWAPDQGGGLGRLAVSSCAVPVQDPAHEQGFFRTLARVPVGRTMTGRDLAQLHLLLDVASAQVVVGSCPGRASLMVLNPPPDEVLAARDSDGDGETDLAELRGGGDPWRAEDGAPCLEHADPVVVPPLCPAPDVGAARAGPTGVLADAQTWKGEVVRVEGRLEVRGHLRLEGTTLLLAPDRSGRAGLEVVSGGTLEVVEGSVIAAVDPAEGFSLRARPGSTLRLLDSRFDHAGHIELDAQGNADRPGLVVETADAELRGNTIRWSLSALELLAGGLVVEGNTLEHTGTGVLVRAPDVVVRGNHATGGGVFVQVDEGAHRARIEDNVVERVVDTAIAVRDGAQEVVIRGNQLLDVHRALELRGARPIQVRDNLIRPCLKQDFPTWEPGLVVEGNTIARPAPGACRLVLETTRPNDPGPAGRPGP